MCGRMYQDFNTEDLRVKFRDLVVKDEVKENYNVAPTMEVPALIFGSKVLVNFRWGLIPHWAKDEKVQFKTFNARAETLEDKPSFREAFKKRRCVILCSGFFEWSNKQPYAIGIKGKKIIALAGLYEEWKNKKDGKIWKTCTIVTCIPNKFMEVYHNRMPVIIDEKDIDNWNNPETEIDELERLLKPTKDKMEAREVDKAVGNVKNNDKKFLS
jgi:putative SOS response-associated peptidase YedK